jgi:hypothetical protein
VIITQNTEIFCVTKMQCVWMFKYVVHVVIICFKRLIGEAWTEQIVIVTLTKLLYMSHFVLRKTVSPVSFVSRKCYMFVTASLLLSSVPRMSSREQPLLYASQHQHLPSDDESQVPLLDAEHSWSFAACPVCHAYFIL